MFKRKNNKVNKEDITEIIDVEAIDIDENGRELNTSEYTNNDSLKNQNTENLGNVNLSKEETTVNIKKSEQIKKDNASGQVNNRGIKDDSNDSINKVNMNKTINTNNTQTLDNTAEKSNNISNKNLNSETSKSTFEETKTEKEKNNESNDNTEHIKEKTNKKSSISLHYKVFAICAIILFSFHLYFGGDKTIVPMLFFVMSAVEAYTKYRETNKKVYKFFSISSVIMSWSFFLLHITYFIFRFVFKFMGGFVSEKATGFFFEWLSELYVYFFGMIL